MSLASVRAFFAEKAPDIAVIELEASTATVAEAVAEGHGVAPAQIAKTLSIRVGDHVALVVTRGDARPRQQEGQVVFGRQGEDARSRRGRSGYRPPGGWAVCPFGLATPLPVYCDVSLQAFDEVVPAAGGTHSSVRIAPARMAELTGAAWVDVCALPT